MKTFILYAVALSLVGGSLAANVEVTFENPESYRDIEYGDGNVKRGIKVHIPILEKHILKQGERFLEEGQSLTMVVTDIDLAGDYEPWRSLSFDDIRIVKSIYPPRIKFTYELKGADGQVLSSGEEHLVDMNFQYRMRTSTHDELFYDKAIITDWMRRLIRNLD